MTPRVAVATARYGDPWDELSVLASRLAGALACNAQVDVLVPAPGSAAPELAWDGACRLLRFPASDADRKLRSAWRAMAFGVDGDEGPGACTCPNPSTRRQLPPFVEEQLVKAEGGDSPALYSHLVETAYDVTLFVGLHSPVTCFGLAALPGTGRALVVPGQYDPGIALTIHGPGLARAERFLVCTETERAMMAARLGGTERVENIGFLLGVNTVAAPEPGGRTGYSVVVVARDWRTAESRRRYRPWAEHLARRLPEGVEVRLVGPGAAGGPYGVPHTDSRIDAWWWMSRAVALVDPEPHRIVGREALEAMLLGVPVVVAANGDASRDHVENGNGGLWYRADDELTACVNRLLDRELTSTVGEQGRAYAMARFGDTDTYIKRLADVVLG